MKKPLRLVLAVVFSGLFLVQSLHRHRSHDGGMSAPHTDCTFCSWIQSGHVPNLPNRGALPAAGLLCLLLALVFSRPKGFSLAFSFDSRAPPASLRSFR